MREARHMTAINTDGETVRGFEVRFTGIRPKDKRKVYKLPCKSEYRNYTGEEALKVMETYTAKGFEPIAFTEANGIMENLDLEEMRWLYDCLINTDNTSISS